MTKNMATDGFNRQDLLTAEDLRKTYGIFTSGSKLRAVLKQAYASNKALRKMMILRRGINKCDILYVRRECVKDFIRIIKSQNPKIVMKSEYITLKDFLHKNCPNININQAYDKLFTIRRHNLVPDDAIVKSCDPGPIYIKREYIDTLRQLFSKKVIHISRPCVADRDVWIGSHRMTTWYHVNKSRYDMDKILTKAYNEKLLPNAAFHPDMSDAARERVLIHCDYVNELITKLNLPVKDGVQRIDWLSPYQISSKLKVDVTFGAITTQIMQSVRDLKLLPDDAFAASPNKRHDNALLLNKKYEGEFVSILDNGHKMDGKRWMSPISLVATYNLPYSLCSLGTYMKQMVKMGEISPSVIITINDIPFLDIRYISKFFAKLDILMDQDKNDRENLMSAIQIKEHYNLAMCYSSIRNCMQMAVDQYVLPADAIITRGNYMFMDKRFVADFVSKLNLILDTTIHTR